LNTKIAEAQISGNANDFVDKRTNIFKSLFLI